MNMLQVRSKRAAVCGFRILLFSGLTLLLGSCQSDWFGEEAEKKPEPKKEEKKEKTQEEKDRERFAFLQKEKENYKKQPKSAPETLEQELLKEENPPEEITKQPPDLTVVLLAVPRLEMRRVPLSLTVTLFAVPSE